MLYQHQCYTSISLIPWSEHTMGALTSAELLLSAIRSLDGEGEIRFLAPIGQHILDRLVEGNRRFPAGGQF